MHEFHNNICLRYSARTMCKTSSDSQTIQFIIVAVDKNMNIHQPNDYSYFQLKFGNYILH